MKMRTRKRKYQPTLRFSPYAWAKLLFLRDQGPTEIGGFGIASEDDSLLIEDVALVKQSCTVATVKFDDAAVANFFDEQTDLGRKPEQFARVWIHTHPGNCSKPSLTDEKTFARVFADCSWAVMLIVAHGGKSYARLRHNQGPKVDVLIRTRVQWDEPFAGSDQQDWLAEYKANVIEEVTSLATNPAGPKILNGWDEQDLAMAFW